MSTPHRATAEEWSQIEKYAATDLNDDYAICLLNIRARVEALEGAANYRQQDEDVERALEPTPTGSLVERVRTAIVEHGDGETYRDEARAAIHEVAHWLRERGGYPDAWMAQMLEQEAER